MQTIHEAFLLMRSIRDDRPTVWTGLALILLVVSIVLAHVVASLFEDVSPVAQRLKTGIGLGRDRSLAEIVGYGFSFLAAVLFFLVWMERQSRALMFLFLLMTFIWLDDAARYHERVGGWLSDALSLSAVGGLRAQDLGELLAWALAGIVLLSALVFAMMRRSPGDLGILGLVFMCFLLLVACGVVFDMLHVLAPFDLGGVIGVLEDGGEMIALALIAIIAIGVARRTV